MYEDKSSSRASARSQAKDVLMRTLREREPELGDHVAKVAELATAVARRMGIEGEQLDVINRAAELHDIGKMAIPDVVLNKPAPLDPDEWRFIADHTIVGERILRAAPALPPSRSWFARATSAGTVRAIRTGSPASGFRWARGSSSPATHCTQ